MNKKSSETFPRIGIWKIIFEENQGSVTKKCAMMFVIENENSQNLGSSLRPMIALAVVMICLCEMQFL